LLHLTPEQMRMEVALDKTIREFNMWHSMTRKPGAPWEYLFSIYERFVEDARLAGTKRKGEVPEVDSASIWRRILDRLAKKEFTYDFEQFGDFDQLSEKVAYFFHESLQGHEAAPMAALTLTRVAEAGLMQGLIANGQCFSVPQLLRDLRLQEPSTPLSILFRPELVVLSHREGVRKPSKSLFAAAYRRVKQLGLEPGQVLYITSRIPGDLEVAKFAGFHTAAYVGEKLGMDVATEHLQNPEMCPDRLLTSLDQVRDVLGV
jgi:FMN phosphatase YigB (HAD superfamily)